MFFFLHDRARGEAECEITKKTFYVLCVYTYSIQKICSRRNNRCPVVYCQLTPDVKYADTSIVAFSIQNVCTCYGYVKKQCFLGHTHMHTDLHAHLHICMHIYL